jgi:hypothetical protein
MKNWIFAQFVSQVNFVHIRRRVLGQIRESRVLSGNCYPRYRSFHDAPTEQGQGGDR